MIVLSIANLEDKKGKYIPFTGRWKDLLGEEQEQTGCWIIYGKPGQGKTRFTLMLARELDEMGYRVMYLTLEMGITGRFKKDVAEAGIRSKVHHIRLCDACTVEELDEYLGSQRSPDFIFVDSIQRWSEQFDARAREIIDLRTKYKNKVFIFTSHVEGKEVEGSVAQDIKKDTFVRIMVAGFRAKYIGRGSGGETGTFTIWEDGARREWLEDK